MSMQEENESGVSRRDLLTTAGIAGVGGLAIGGVAGGLIGSQLGGDGDGGTETSSAASSSTSTGAPLVIGSPYPLTGPYAADGEQMENGTKMAIDEINAKGGVAGRKLEQRVVDTEVDSPESVTASLKKLVGEEVDAIVGGYLQVDAPAYDILPPYGAPYLHGNTLQEGVDKVAADPERFYMMFNVDPTEVWYGRGFPAFLDSLEAQAAWSPSSKTISIIEGDLVYSQIISKATQEAMKKEGWKVTGVDKVITPVSEWGPTLQSVRSQDPAIVYNSHPAPADQAAFMKQFVANPTQSLVYLQYGPSIPQFLELAGSAANGAIWSTVVGNVGGVLGQAFTKKYQKQFGAIPGLANAPQGYDSIYMLANAWGMVEDSRDFKAVCDQIRVQRYRGVCGSYYMDQPGQYTSPYPEANPDPSLAMPHLYLQVQNGEHKVIYPEPYAEGKFEMPPWMNG